MSFIYQRKKKISFFVKTMNFYNANLFTDKVKNLYKNIIY